MRILLLASLAGALTPLMRTVPSAEVNPSGNVEVSPNAETDTISSTEPEADYDYEIDAPSSQEPVVISEEDYDYDVDETPDVPLVSLLSMREMGPPIQHAPRKPPALSLFNLLMHSKLNSFSDYDYDLGVGGSTPLSLLNLLFMLPHVASRPPPPPPVGLLTITVHSGPVPVRSVNIGSGRDYYGDNLPAPRPPMPPFRMPQPPMKPVPVQTLLILPRQEPVQTSLVLPQEPLTPPPAESEPESVPPSPPSQLETSNQIPVEKPSDGPIEETVQNYQQLEANSNAIPPPKPPAVEIASQDESNANSEISPEKGRAPRSIKPKLPDIVSYRSAP